jgi:hypothetical protein
MLAILNHIIHYLPLMRPLDKFILHVTHNLFPLNEYSEGEIKRLMDKFREEADDLNISITDEQLKVFIERFDSLKDSPKVTEKDLRKYSLSKLIRLIGGFKGGEIPEPAENTPDVVYNENGLVIYNGSKEDNCLTYGRGERWCITRGSFGNYRYDADRKFPTFYLVKDNNLSDDDPKSFFIVIVGNDNTYKVSDRTNNDIGGQQTEWRRWEPWAFIERNFPSVEGLRNVFKYIPLSNKEKINQQYKNEPVSIREWIKFPYSVKEQYLVVRKDKRDLFSDVSKEEFVEKYLVRYPQIATFVATNEGVISPEILVKYLDKFSNQDRKSIMVNMRTKLNPKLLELESIPFDVKKLLVKLDKWDLDVDERLYTTTDGNAIVKLTLGDNLKMTVYTEDDDYPNVKINKRTGKYLADNPEIDSLPFKDLLKLSADEILPSDTVDKVLKKGQEDPDSGIIVKDIEGGKIIVDTNSFTSFKKEGSRITPVNFNSEEVQNALEGENENASLQDNAVKLFKNGREIPSQVDKESLINIVNSTPFDARRFTLGNSDDQVVLLAIGEGDESQFILMRATPLSTIFLPLESYNKGENWRETTRNNSSRFINYNNLVPAYVGYLRNENIALTDSLLKSFLNNQGVNDTIKHAFFETDPLLANDNTFIPKKIDDRYFLINRRNPRESLELSPSRNNLKRYAMPASAAARLLGNRPEPATPGGEPEAGETRRGRGRPAGVPNTPRQQAAAEPNEGEIGTTQLATDLGLLRGLSTMSPRIASRFPRNWRPISVNNNRGASRRQNQLGGAGRVRQAFESGSNAMYNITLNDGTELLSIVLQPGNTHLLATPTGTVLLNSPSDLVSTLQARNLVENIKKAAVKMYLAENPTMLDETMDIIKNLLNKKS